MPECPYCGKVFKTEKGLRQHITKVHKEKTEFGQVLDPSTIDIEGKLERRAKRKKKGWLF